MVAHLTEEEQLDALKRWWKENGKSTVIAIGVLLAGFFGWNQYQDHKIAKADEGSEVFERFMALTTSIEDQATSDQKASIEAVAAELSQKNGSSLYSDFAQLYLAKLSVQGGDLDSAMVTLAGISSNSKDSAIQELASLRYARVLAAKGDTEKALQTLGANVSAAYKPAYEEAKGDVLLSAKRISEAHKAYKSALQSLGADQFMRRNMVQLKIDHTAVASETAAATSENSAETINPHAASMEAGDA